MTPAATHTPQPARCGADIQAEIEIHELDSALLQIAARDQAIKQILELMKPEDRKWTHAELTTPEYYAWCLAVPIYCAAKEIASSLDKIACEIEAEGVSISMCPKCFLAFESLP